MNLEDHLGDILRKAGIMNAVSAGTAARAAGLSEQEYTALETSGQPAKKIDFAALGKILGLHPQKLAGIAQGWLPEKKTLSRWHQLRQFTTREADFSVNCFLIWDENTRTAALFDTGLEASPILECLAAEQLSLRHIFITHSHYDHVEALPKLRQAFPDARLHSNSKSAPAGQHNHAGEAVAVGSVRITHRDTPGHAKDGVTYVIENWPENAPAVAVVGDTIFAGSMGNGNGAWEVAKQKVREQILSLPPETLICPGHGPLTTVGEEQKFNPFF
ncbi:MAG TPA: MBL fold metallo-hydrolase [Verrucomicrobiae bacterium]|jgi:glyoxylase-like metal-dependent hydrolase (beta-lactamase superfamily II)